MLRELQQQFIGHILGAADGIVEKISEDSAFTPEQGLQVYKNTTHLLLTDLLLQGFPAVTKLVDEKFMRYAAHAFWSSQPPSSGDMNDYGAAFPEFLRNFPPLAAHPYISGVAALEWARQRAYLSPLHPAVSPETVAQTPPEQLYLSWQPHVHVLASVWPVVDIWNFALHEGEQPCMEAGEHFALVHRHKNTVAVQELDKGGYTFLMALKQGLNLSAAAEAAVAAEPDFDFGRFLGERLRSGLLVKP